jgi:hypothetical protein
LGAHVQDLDFGLRIDLWNGIDVAKIGFFVEGAVETYESLAGFNLPGYLPLPNAPQDLTAPDFLAALDRFRASGTNPGNADHELTRLEILSNIADHRQEVLEGAARVRRDYVLGAAQEERVDAIVVSPEP